MEFSAEMKYVLDSFWLLISGCLVMWMAAGFAMLEAGLVRTKNTTAILTKNIALYALACVAYYYVGYNIMYGNGNSFIGSGVMMSGTSAEGHSLISDFFFQVVFVATAASIVSGTVAERIKFWPFMGFILVLTALIYPIQGHWSWGGTSLGGILDGFSDFAGSTIVHSVGGWAGLAGVLLLGARKGKFDINGKPQAIPGSNIPLSAAGVLILWLGWFGFNGGSVLSADPANTSLVLVTTCLAAAAGGLGAAFFSGLLYRNLDLTMFMNGVLGGLVAITAGADQMSPNEAIMIGVTGGIIVVLGVSLLDKAKLDDPVGAIPVHLFSGIWGTLAVGIFGASKGLDQFIVQLASVGIVGVFCVISTIAITLLVKSTVGLRVTEREEMEGLDIAEHGTGAYADFAMK